MATAPERAARAPVDRASVEFAKCSADAAYFADAFLVIDDAQGQGDGGGTMPFRLWPAQVGVMWALMTEGRVVILKARQLGISWVCCGYALWLVLFQSGKIVLLFSQGQAEANELLRRIRVLYERLPDWLIDACPLARPPNMSEIAWANGSRVRSLPATQKAGRSFTASLVILDEAAHMQFAGDLYTAAKPTVDAGNAQLVILSTGNGTGNLFHRIWTKAIAGLNGFRTIFLPWWARPGRDAAWYEERVAEAVDPELVKQEYPASSNEAFIASGRVRFHPDWIQAQARNIKDPIPRKLLPTALRAIDGLSVYRLPEPESRHRMLIGADVAEGLEHGDFSAAVLADAAGLEEWASLHGRWEPDEFAGLLFALSLAYDARIAVERNNHGHAVLAVLARLEAEARLPYRPGFQRVLYGHDRRPGWLTSKATKPQAIDRVAECLRDGAMVVRSQATLDELQVYSVLAGGKTGAPEDLNDDRVMSWAVLLGWQAVVGWGPEPDLIRVHPSGAF